MNDRADEIARDVLRAGCLGPDDMCELEEWCDCHAEIAAALRVYARSYANELLECAVHLILGHEAAEDPAFWARLVQSLKLSMPRSGDATR